MKRILLSSALAISLTGVVTGQSPAKPVSAEPTAFQAVTAKLDPGGSLYAYVSTDQLLGRLSAKVEEIRDLVLGFPLEDRERAQARLVFTLLDNVIRHSGVESITGFGVSGIAVEKGLYRTRAVVQRTPGSEGYIWWWFGEKAGPLDLLEWLPADTVYAASMKIDFAAIWAAVQREARAAGVDPALEGMADLSSEVKHELGSSVEDLLASLDGTVGFALRLDPEKEFEVPLPNGAPLNLPEPALMIAIKVKNDLLFDTILKQIQAEIPEEAIAEGQEDGARWIGMNQPLPLPFPVQPMLARSGDYLWLASTGSLLTEARQVRSGNTPGLKTTAEFQRLSRGLPLRGNSFGFVSERFGSTLAGIQDTFMKQVVGGEGHAGAAEMTILAQQLSLYTHVPASYVVGWFDGEGAQSVGQGTREPVGQIASAVLVAPTAMFAGMMLPALAKAKGKAQEINCMNNMKQILLGLIMYADDNDGTFPQSLKDIANYLGSPQVLHCPLDPRGSDAGPAAWEDFDPSDCSYEFVTPGIKIKETERPSEAVALRCKFHGHKGFLDGHVERAQ